jgi:uncharacterized protein (UPF0333 family)
MMKQKGVISTGLVIALVAVAFFGLVGLTVFGSYVSAYNYGNKMENQLVAVQQDNKNILAQYGQKVMEVAQVPTMYKDDLVKVTTAAIQGRYGADGSKATFQWLKEQNPNLDASLYKQIQQVIEAGRDNFENGQRGQIDLLRQYNTQLGSFWGGMWLKFAGYPKVNLADFAIVSTGRADDAFKNHKEDGPIQLR